MPAAVSLLLLTANSLLLGWLLVRQFGIVPGHWLELVMASFVLGTAVIGWTAFVLAEVGRFSLPLIGAIWLALVVFLSARLWKQAGRATAGKTVLEVTAFSILPSLPARAEHLLLFLWLASALWLYFRPHQFVLGAADAGVYVNLAASIAGSGGILVPEAVLDGVPQELGELFARKLAPESVAPYIVLPGFYAYDLPTDTLVPQFYHLHPVWQALAYGLTGSPTGGAQAALMLTGLWSLAGALAIYLTVRQFAGWQVALLTLAGLTVNALQVWFARYPTTEAMSQFYLWAGFWATGAWLSGRRPQRLWPLLGGLSLGLFFLVRIDAIMIAPALALLGVWALLNVEFRCTFLWYFLPATFMWGHSLVHGYWQSRPYFFDLFGLAIALLSDDGWLALVIAAATGGFFWLLLRARGRLARLQNLRPWLLGAFVGCFALYATYGWFVRPEVATATVWLDPFSASPIPLLDHENWPRLGWYLSPVGLGLGVAGISLLIWRLERKTVLWVCVGLLFAVFFLWRIRANPHQVYAMRRYVPAVMPLFIIGAAYTLAWLGAQRRRLISVLALLLALIWLVGLAWSARGFVRQVDYPGIMPQLAQLDAQLGQHAILLFNDPNPITQGDIIGTPLRFLFGHDILSVRDPDAEQMDLLQTAIDGWTAEGRAVYWIHAPEAQTALAPANIAYMTTYRLETSLLEMTYTHRPQAVQAVIWTGELYRVLPASGADSS